MEAKQDIRKHVLAVRNALTMEEWNEKSMQIFSKIIAHPFFLESEEIYCYIDFRNEVGTRRLIETAWKIHKKVAVPKIEGNEMQFYYIDSWDDVSVGRWGILEPSNARLAEGKSVLVIMPGSVFDINLNRIGYGGGYYDKYLSKHDEYTSIALAFEFQIFDSIPTEIYDIKPQCVITEEKIYA